MVSSLEKPVWPRAIYEDEAGEGGEVGVGEELDAQGHVHELDCLLLELGKGIVLLLLRGSLVGLLLPDLRKPGPNDLVREEAVAGLGVVHVPSTVARVHGLRVGFVRRCVLNTHTHN